MKTRMDSGMSRAAYKVWIHNCAIANARKEIKLTMANVTAELARTGLVSDRAADAADKGVATLARLQANQA